jgi:hypothetical protein
MIEMWTSADNTFRLTNGDVFSGDRANVIVADVARARAFVAGMDYPLPQLRLVVLPFCLLNMNGQGIFADAVTDYAASTIYLGAQISGDFLPGWSEPAFLKSSAHEIGHLVHARYLPPWQAGTPTGKWADFASVQGYKGTNDSYLNAINECFAESWRLCFTDTGLFPHKQGYSITPGLRAWFLALAGGNHIDLWLNSRRVVIDGREATLDTAPILNNGRSLVPLRFVAETFGATVIWHDDGHIEITR